MVNPLTHIFFSHTLLNHHITNEDDAISLSIGSILPDICLSGLIPYNSTHTKNAEFLEWCITREEKIAALAAITHAEKPYGIDHYTHNTNGFIHTHHDKVKSILLKYPYFNNANMMTVHHCIEFIIDHLLVEKYPGLPLKAVKHLQSDKAQKIVHKYTEFHSLSVKDRVKINKIFKHKLLEKYLLQFGSIKGTAKNWQTIRNYYTIKKHARSKREQLKLLAKLGTKHILSIHKIPEIISAFTEVKEYLNEHYEEFINDTLENVNHVVKKYETHLN